MNKDFYKLRISITIIFILLCSSIALSSEGEIIKIQGVIMSLDLKKNVMIVNERFFVLNRNTAVYNDKGIAIAITIDQLKPNTWVYIEGLKGSTDKGIVTRKIYLLPKYIKEKEKHLYPFIE
jgi:hypothetical protein